MIIRPMPGLILRDPDQKGRIMPPEGKTVAKLSPFWLRLKNEGSLQVLPEPAPITPRTAREEEK